MKWHYNNFLIVFIQLIWFRMIFFSISSCWRKSGKIKKMKLNIFKVFSRLAIRTYVIIEHVILKITISSLLGIPVHRLTSFSTDSMKSTKWRIGLPYDVKRRTCFVYRFEKNVFLWFQNVLFRLLWSFTTLKICCI